MNIHQNLLQLKIKSYTFLRIIGQGNYSKVYEVFDQKTQQNFAAKVIPKHLLNVIPRFESLLKSQISVLMKCRNENVISFKQNLSNAKNIVIIMELCNGGMLLQYLHKKGRLSEDQATCFLKQILNGFKGLHQVNAIHRDINASNILLHNKICKIIDLGYSKKLKQGELTETIFGVSPTMAPQMLEQKQYDNKADIWSIGILYYQLIFGEYPYKGQNSAQLLKDIKKVELNLQKIKISQHVKDFIVKCLKYDVNQRISWAQIYEHPLITSDQSIKYILFNNLQSKIKENKIYYSNIKSQSSIQHQSHIKAIQQSPVTKRKTIYQQSSEDQQKSQIKYSLRLGRVPTKQDIQKSTILQNVIYNTTKSSINIKTIMQQNQQKMKQQQKILQYQKKYLNYRNRIMFIFKYIIPSFPLIYYKTLIKMRHQTIAFLISKNAFLQMQQLLFNYKFQLNFMKVDVFWDQFIKSKKYEQLKQMFQTDMVIITLQLQQFKRSLSKNELDNQLKQQLDIKKSYKIYWNDYINNIIEVYQLDLIKLLQKSNEKLKNKLILLIKSLQIYRKQRQNGQIQDICKRIENINYQWEEIVLFQRLFQH